jgi:glycosyltransferase involved in cell wall biosynthesis
MSTLRVILDQMVAPVPGGIGRYTEELTRALIATAPRGSAVAGIVAASPEDAYRLIHERLPGLAGLHKNALARRELAAAWQHGFTRPPGHGMVHAPSLLAPLFRHDRTMRQDDQTVVTIHDVVPWTHPETLTPRGVSWHKAMAARAQQYADAIVVPTHAVAAALDAILDVTDRIRVIGGAATTALRLPSDAERRAVELNLPDRFVLSVGTLEPRKGLDQLIRAMAFGVPSDVPLLVVGAAGWGGVDVPAIAADAGLDEARVRVLGRIDDADLAVALDRAAVFAFPSLAEGFGLPVVEAFALGTPVVHSDAPAVVEVAAGAGLEVPLADLDGYPQRLADALRSVLEDSALAARLSVSGSDRAKAFSWRDSAEKVWQLHADL